MAVDPARQVAAELERRGLAAPARLLADAHRPLGPLLADLGVAVGPLARAIGGTRVGPLTRWLEDQDALGRLVVALDAEGEPRAEPG
ncbi:MAG: hypothetical protein ACXWWU_11050 [Candidatus Limnocylindria bacterium]